MTGFTIPNTPDAGYGDQAEPDARDFEILGRQGLYGVLSGCVVAAQGSPNMTVAVSSGIVLNNGALVAVTSGNVTIGASAVNPRIDMVVVDGSGVKSAIAGTASTNARCAVLPSGYVCLAFVYVPGGATSIAANQITDKQVYLPTAFLSSSAAVGDRIVGARVNGDAADRLTLFAGNGIGLGDGTLAQDVTISRTAAGVLTVVGTVISNNLQRGTAATPEGAITGSVGDLFIKTNGASGTVVWYKSSGNATNTGWLPLGAARTVVVPHTWTIGGDVVVAVGDNDFICPFFVPVPTGQTVFLRAARYRINAGTSATVKLQKNGSDITGFTGIAVSTTTGYTDPTDVALTDADRLALVVTAVSGSPKNLTMTLELIYTF